MQRAVADHRAAAQRQIEYWSKSQVDAELAKLKAEVGSGEAPKEIASSSDDAPADDTAAS